MSKFYVNENDILKAGDLLDEDTYFREMQKFMVPFANSSEGRDLLGIDRSLPRVLRLDKNAVVCDIGGGERMADFRVGSKFANVIRFRWSDWQRALDAYARRNAWRPLREWLPTFGFLPSPAFARMLAGSSLTAYPQAHPETTTSDAYLDDDTDNQTWADKIAAGGDVVGSDGTDYRIAGFVSGSTSGWQHLYRAVFLFDTSLLGPVAVKTGATLSLAGQGKADGLSATPNINTYSSNPASSSNPVAGDFDSLGSTAFCDTAVAYASWQTGGTYNDFALNATGLAAVDPEGVTKLGTRNANCDVAATEPSRPGNNLISYLKSYMAEQTGTSADPKLVVTYTGTGSPQDLLLRGVGG